MMPVVGQRLQVRARLAELDAAALDVADAKALADERVQAHAARRELTARLARRELDAVLGGELLELLALDQRQVLLGRGARLELAIAAKSCAGDRLDALDRVDRRGDLRGEVDAHDLGHGPRLSVP